MSEMESSQPVMNGAIAPKNLSNPDISYPTIETEPDLRFLNEFSWRDGAEILLKAWRLVPGLNSIICIPGTEEFLKMLLGLDKYSPKEMVKGKQFEWLLDQTVAMSKMLNSLIEQLPPEKQPEPADVASVYEAALGVSRKTADYKKRKLLKNALVNAFDLKQYESGITIRLFSILEDIEYAEVELLGRLSQKDIQPLRDVAGMTQGSLGIHHIEVLSKLGLVLIWNKGSDPLGMEPNNANAMVTELGKKFLNFVTDPSLDELELHHTERK